MLAGGGGADEDAASVAAKSSQADLNAKEGLEVDNDDDDADYAARDALIQASYIRPNRENAEELGEDALRAYGERVFAAWFDAEIQNKMTKKVYKTATHTPTPIRISDVSAEIAAMGNPSADLMGGGA